jgi:pimeloyl-ACP methyl ester carboxylesterase
VRRGGRGGPARRAAPGSYFQDRTGRGGCWSATSAPRLPRGLSWYRNIDRSWELLAPFAGARVTVPALYVAGDRDLVVAFRGMDQLLANLTRFVPRLAKTIMLPGCGHGTQQERPREVNAAMLEFLRTQ